MQRGCPMILSKLPIVDVSVHCLENNIGIERIAPRGVTRFKIAARDSHINIYSAHTQPVLGKERAEARIKQIDQMKKIMSKDKKDACPQILVGDFNTSRINAWGGDNCKDPNNPEKMVQEKFNKAFDNLYFRHHDPDTGLRRNDAPPPTFLAHDNQRMDLAKDALAEPTATWFTSTFNNPDTFMTKQVQKHNEQDQKKHGYTAPSIFQTTALVSFWGKKNWRNTQSLETAHFDAIVLPRHEEKTCDSEGYLLETQESPLDGYSEIRRIKVPDSVESSSSDHAPEDAMIYYKTGPHF